MEKQNKFLEALNVRTVVDVKVLNGGDSAIINIITQTSYAAKINAIAVDIKHHTFSHEHKCVED